MWTYIVAALFIMIGSLELAVAFNGRLRKALLETGALPANRVGPAIFAIVGCSALATGIGILVYGLLW